MTFNFEDLEEDHCTVAPLVRTLARFSLRTLNEFNKGEPVGLKTIVQSEMVKKCKVE